MDFNTYSKMILCKMKLYLGSDYEVEAKQVSKNNGIILNGIIAKKVGSNLFPTVYIDEYYSENITPEEVEYIAMKLSSGVSKNSFDITSFISEFQDFETAKSHIIFKLINADKNKELLMEIPYRRFHNLAICYCYYVEGIKDSDNGTILIRNEHLNSWNILEDELYNCAYENTNNVAPALYHNMKDIISSMYGADICMDNVRMGVVTNKSKFNGAYALLYIDKMREFADILGEDYYIIPSSIHELIIVPKSACDNVKELLNMVVQVNRTEVSAEDYLADSIYAYDSELDEIVWIC